MGGRDCSRRWRGMAPAEGHGTAPRGEIVRLVVRQGMIVALAGIVAGTVAALGLTRLMSSLLFQVKPNDPVTFAVVALGLAVTALMASWVPAFRAARVDPLSALR